jgi:O-antigen biosynthesis protein
VVLKKSMSEAVTKTYGRAVKLPEFGSLNVIQKLCGEGREILDVGCSTGYLGKILIANRNTVYGIDGNQEAVKVAQEVYAEAIHMDLNSLPEETVFRGRQFDIIVFADVLEHLLYPLRPNGQIIVSLPNVALWRVRLNLLFGKFDYADYGVLDRTHLHLYTFRSGKELLLNAGYRIRSTSSAVNLSFFGLLIRLVPWLKSLLGIHIIIKADTAPKI